jgi:two-component system cell cycle response regulator
VIPAASGSFKVKLVAYFLLLSLLPAAAAFWGFSAVARESETRRVEARLQAGLRAAIAAYEEQVEAATRAATALAANAGFQSALINGERTAVLSTLLETPNIRLESQHLNIGARPRLAVEREIRIVSEGRRIGSLFVSVAFDQQLVARLQRRSGLTTQERVIVVSEGRITTGPGWLSGRVEAHGGRTTSVEIAGSRYLILLAPGDIGGATLGVLSPESAIEAASATLQRRLALGLFGAVLLISLVAYFEGRSIVRSVSRIAQAANAIARGDLAERVPVRGRDELARLANAFNQMADQLQARLEELESERSRLRDALARFGEALAATHHPEQLLRVIVETAVEATGAHGGMIVSSDGTVIEVGATGSGGAQLELALQASRSNFGTLFLFGRHFDEDASVTAVSLVSQSVMALENARLHRIVKDQAHVDGLTGLANRRHAEEVLAAEISRALRFGGSLAVVMTDLDHFKSVNDEHGHPVGDTVLRRFARLLEASIRDVDLAARWGGEEFLLILPGTDGAGAARLAERIRTRLAETTLLTPEGVPIVATASFGVAATAEEPGSAEELVAEADAALYAAKRAGRNRVESAGEPVTPQ